MKELNVNLSSFTGNELILREGDVLPHHEPVKIKLAGDIKSISKFLEVRKSGEGHEHQKVDINKAVVTVDKKKMTIFLSLDPGNVHSTEVTGTLEFSDELEKWGINSGQKISLADLKELIRFNRLDFDVSDQQKSLLDAYQRFNIKTAIEMSAESDNKGNKRSAYEKKVDFGLPTVFVLNIPIFKGFASSSFTVEICLQPTDSTVTFWLESVELHELIATRKEQIINDELVNCEGFVIINQ